VPLPKSLGRRLLIGVLFGVAVYAGILIWADLGAVLDAVRGMPLWVLPAACALSLCNYVVRFWKWQRYCQLLGIRLERRTSFLIYLSGLTMSVTPGKMGEVFKSWLVRKVTGVRISESAPIVVAERLTDLLGYMILVAIGGLSTEPEFGWIFWSMLAVCVVALVLVGSEQFARLCVVAVAKAPVVSRLAPRVEIAFGSTRKLLALREMFGPTLVSVIGWGLECTGFWLIANEIVPGGMPYLYAVFAFAFSAVIGAVALIAPGGLGVTEFSLGRLIVKRIGPDGIGESGLGLTLEVARQKAAGMTILARLCTLWFAVFVGFVATALFTRQYGEVEDEPDEGAARA